MSGWSPDRVEVLKKRHADGWSAGQIAKELRGFSRNAIIGKIHRLGLNESREPSAPKVRAPKAPAVKRATQQNAGMAFGNRRAATNPIFSGDPTLSPLEKRLAVNLANAEARSAAAATARTEEPGLATVLTLSAHMCKWPIGDPQRADFTFCGRRRGDGPYCSEHARVAYQPRATTAKRSRAELIHGLRRYI